MATYTVKEVKDTGFQDPHGNHWLNAAFREYGEPVSLVVKDPSTITEGKELNGEIKQVPKKNGNGTYNRFFRDKPQDFGGNQGSAPKREWKERDDKAIQAQWAINQGREAALLESDDPAYFKEVEDHAKQFFLMIDRVRATEPQAITAGDIHKEALSLVDDAKPVDVSDIPFN